MPSQPDRSIDVVSGTALLSDGWMGVSTRVRVTTGIALSLSVVTMVVVAGLWLFGVGAAGGRLAGAFAIGFVVGLVAAGYLGYAMVAQLRDVVILRLLGGPAAAPAGRHPNETRRTESDFLAEQDRNLRRLEHIGTLYPGRRQSVVDDLCLMLREPGHSEPEIDRAWRLAVQRLLSRHLNPVVTELFWPDISLDLTGARLIDFDLDGCLVARATFTRTSFFGRSSFVGARFMADASFRSAKFYGEADFSWARFGGLVRYERSIFLRDCDFSETEFDTEALFEEATFEGDVFFSPREGANPSFDFSDTRFDRFPVLSRHLLDSDLSLEQIFRGARLPSAVQVGHEPLSAPRTAPPEELVQPRPGQAAYVGAVSESPAPKIGEVDVAVWISDESAATEVQRAVRGLLAAVDGLEVWAGEPEIGSWSRRFRFWMNHEGRDVAAELEHMVRQKLVLKEQAEIDSKQAAAVSALIGSLSAVESAAIQVGSLLLVKTAPTKIACRNLTPVELNYLNRYPSLLGEPATLLGQLDRLDEATLVDDAGRPALPSEPPRGLLDPGTVD